MWNANKETIPFEQLSHPNIFPPSVKSSCKPSQTKLLVVTEFNVVRLSTIRQTANCNLDITKFTLAMQERTQSPELSEFNVDGNERPCLNMSGWRDPSHPRLVIVTCSQSEAKVNKEEFLDHNINERLVDRYYDIKSFSRRGRCPYCDSAWEARAHQSRRLSRDERFSVCAELPSGACCSANQLKCKMS